MQKILFVLAKGWPLAAFHSPFGFPSRKTVKRIRRHTDAKVSTKGNTRTKMCVQKEYTHTDIKVSTKGDTQTKKCLHLRCRKDIQTNRNY